MEVNPESENDGSAPVRGGKSAPAREGRNAPVRGGKNAPVRAGKSAPARATAPAQARTTAPARRTQVERTAATRATLIAAARKLFATNGFSDVSTQAIVAAAGVTRGALYHQFADKTELFAAVYEQVEAELVTDVAAGIVAEAPTGPLEAMRIGARLFLDRCSAPDAQRIVLVDAPSVLGWDRWRAVGVKYGLGVIESMLAQAVDDGSIPAQPLRPTAHVLLGALDEAALYVSRADDPQRARAEMYTVCDRLISGIAG